MNEVKHTPEELKAALDEAYKAWQDDQRLRDAAAEMHRELRGARCPRPCNHRPDEFEVGQCVDAGECGCSLGAAIAKAEGRS